MNWEEFCKINEIGKKFHSINISSLPDALKILGNKWARSPHSLILMGKPGRGKSYFTLCLVRYLIEKGKEGDVSWRRSKQIDDELFEEYASYNSYKNCVKRFSNIPILFLDDFGIERGSETTIRNYYEIINSRWENEFPTVISTNLSEDDIFKFYGERIYSRLKDYQRIEFEGPDLRG